MAIKDGGPAFPVPHSIDGNWNTEPVPEFRGMTLRDYFAAKAMAAMIVARSDECIPGGWPTGAERTAYLIADAMIEVRDGR